MHTRTHTQQFGANHGPDTPTGSASCSHLPHPPGLGPSLQAPRLLPSPICGAPSGSPKPSGWSPARGWCGGAALLGSQQPGRLSDCRAAESRWVGCCSDERPGQGGDRGICFPRGHWLPEQLLEQEGEDLGDQSPGKPCRPRAQTPRPPWSCSAPPYFTLWRRLAWVCSLPAHPAPGCSCLQGPARAYAVPQAQQAQVLQKDSHTHRVCFFSPSASTTVWDPWDQGTLPGQCPETSSLRASGCRTTDPRKPPIHHLIPPPSSTWQR